MNTYDYLIIGVMFAGLLSISAFIGYEYGVGVERLNTLEMIPDCDLKCPKIPDCVCPDFECPAVPEQPQILMMAKNVAEEIPYDREEWNCLDKSRELVRRLREAGYNARVVKGRLLLGNNNEGQNVYGGHAWVEVDNLHIEATSGDIITPKGYENDYIEER